jgi:hypothetical protein
MPLERIRTLRHYSYLWSFNDTRTTDLLRVLMTVYTSEDTP